MFVSVPTSFTRNAINSTSPLNILSIYLMMEISICDRQLSKHTKNSVTMGQPVEQLKFVCFKIYIYLEPLKFY